MLLRQKLLVAIAAAVMAELVLALLQRVLG